MWYKFVDFLDSIVNGVTMYRLLLYYLLSIAAGTIILSIVGDMNYKPIQIAIEMAVIVAACYVINKILAYIFVAPLNPESSILTGLILALIIPPSTANYGILFYLAASGLAMASKYILSIREKHIFNPAAIAVVLTAFGAHQHASWWIGSAAILPVVIIGGILVLRKLRREHMFIVFLVVTALTTAILSVVSGASAIVGLKNMVLASPVFFLGFVMLTEPYTSPTTAKQQMIYGALVGFLLAPQVHLFSFYTTPEIALIIGNLYAYIVSNKTKLFPVFADRFEVAKNILEFKFAPDAELAYKPGQYMEWTFPHKPMDSRGARRWFTLSSSPTEEDISIGIKFYEDGSTFKEAMLSMDSSSSIVAGQLAGDFVMPKDQSKKLVFIAGGIGVTPFRSMIKYLVDTGEKRSVRMFYAASSEDELAYRDVFEDARRELGIQTMYVVTGNNSVVRGRHTIKGKITENLIEQYIPDLEECIFYISGTHGMVEDMTAGLRDLGVHSRNIKTDYFSGYA